MANPRSSVQLQPMKPVGFRFHPTHEELVSHYLVPKTRGDNVEDLLLMAEVILCKHEPWDLPDKSIMKSDDQAWYFFCPRELKNSNRKCSNRRTKAGFWKSTCQGKPIKTKHTKKVIGIRKTLVFHEKAGPKAKRTGWILDEYDIITDSSLSKEGQYVLCRLKKKPDEKTKKGEQNHHMTAVSDSDAEPSQSMASNSESQNGSAMTVNSAFDARELGHHVATYNSETQNSNELVNNSDPQVSELNHYMASDSRNQNSNKVKSNSAYAGSGSLDSMSSNSKTLYWNQPTVGSDYEGGKSHYKAFDPETQISNNMITMPTNENWLMACEKWLMAPDIKNQESPSQPEGDCGPSVVIPSLFINKSTNDLASEFINKNADKEIDISAFDEWSSLTETPPDFGNQNPCKKIDMSPLEEGYSSNSTTSISDNNLADVALPEQVPVGSKKESPPLPGDWKNLVAKSKAQALVLFPSTPLSCFQLPTEVSASPFFQDQIPVLGRVMNSDFSSEWYFFCPRDLKYKKKSRLCNRKTKAGYWKSTCKIKPIMAGHTKKNIGVMKTLAFYKKARPKDVRTGWMIYEFDIVTNSILSKKGQYVLCRLENRSDERIKKGEQNHLMASVSVSEAVPGQSMTSDFENQNSSEMVVSLASDDSELSHHVGSDSGNQNSSELTPARLVSELSHYMASDFRNQNSCNTGSNLAYDGSGSCHSTSFNSETQYLNQPTVGSVCIVNKNHYMAFDLENQNPNELLTVDSVSTVSKNHYMAFDLENQNPNELLTVDSVYTVSKNHYMAFDLENQNPNELPTVDSAYTVSNNHYMAFDSEYQNPNELLTADSVYDVSESQYMSFDSENQNLNIINSTSTYENSLMASHGFENKNPPFPPGGECGPSVVMPFKFINQSTYDESELSSLLAPDFGNQNLDKEINLPAFDEGEWSSLTAIPSDFGNENPSKKADISTHEEGYSSYLTGPFSENNLADVSLPDVSPELLAGAQEAIFEQKKSLNTVLQPPVCVEESHSYMDYDTSTST
ncbi:hypothetical protein NC652_006660 [Populus alba x Populus x berolinensis]|nr:hypothetical protein NC652_006660 [Populus alba x Populus x berolinensis]